MKKHGYEGKVLQPNEFDKEFLKQRHQFFIPGNLKVFLIFVGTKDKKGRMLTYVIMSRMRMKEFPLKTHIEYSLLLWQLSLNEG
jgi:hypothetical protein